MALAPSTGAPTEQKAPPKILNVFISYSRQDDVVASAVRRSLEKALDRDFCQVDMDKYTFNIGGDFPTDIRTKLMTTHVLLVVHTDKSVPNYSYPGMELGWFLKVIDEKPTLDNIDRRVVPVFLYAPPAVLQTTNGIFINISNEQLSKTRDAYEKSLDLGPSDSAVRFLISVQDDI